MIPKPLRTAILGCGGFAHRHAQNINELPDDTRLVAFCDQVPGNAQLYSERYTNGKAPTYTDFHDMLDHEDLDLLVIALPPFAHTDEVEVAASRGVHLLMEKPIALSMDHAWRMVRAVEAAGVKTQVGFMWRFGEAIESITK